MHEGPQDTVLALCPRRSHHSEPSCSVWRFAHRVAVHSLAQPLGRAALGSGVRWLVFDGGKRALVGCTTDRQLLVSYLPRGGGLGPPTPLRIDCRALFAPRPGRDMVGVVTAQGALYELVFGASAPRAAGRLPPPQMGRQRLRWDPRGRQWVLHDPLRRHGPPGRRPRGGAR